MTLAEEIKGIFDSHGYKWKISGTLQSPTTGDIEKTIAEARRLLSLEKEPAVSLEVGRLIVKKSQGHYDVYVLIESTKETP